jgi:hypothetical protein
MHTTKIISIILSVFLILNLFSQNLEWVNTYDGSLGGVRPYQRTFYLAQEDGYTYCLGTFNDSVDLDPSSGHLQGSSHSNGYTMFLQKIDKSGRTIWTNQYHTQDSLLSGVTSLSVMNGKIHLSAWTKKNFDIDPGPNTFMIQYDGNFTNNHFTAAFDTSGNFIWCKTLGSPNSNGFKGHSVNNQGEVLMFGVTGQNTIDLDPDPNSQYQLNVNVGKAVMYLIKLSPNGQTLWIKHSEADYYLIPYKAILSNDNSVFVTGVYRDSIDFDFSLTEQKTVTSGFHDFLLKLDTSGDLFFGRPFEYNSTSFPFATSGLSIDKEGNVLFSRPCFGQHDCDPSSSNQVLFSTNGNYDQLLIKFSGLNGDYIWHKQFGGTGDDYINRLYVDVHNNYHLAGIFTSPSIDLNPGINSYVVTTNGDNNNSNAYVRLNSNGEFIVGGITDDDDGTLHTADMVVDKRGHVIFSGTYTNATVDFDPTPGQALKSAIAQEDNWMAKYSFCIPSSSTFSNISADACEFFISPSGLKLSSSGTYMDTISNHVGCDSIITIDLTINNSAILHIDTTHCSEITSPTGKLWNVSGLYYDTLSRANGCDSILEFNVLIVPLNANVINDSTSLIAEETGAQYQWLDCNIDFQEITGATSRFYFPNSGGQYAVAISKNGCVDTSDCYINTVGIEEIQNLDLGLYISPNPFTHQIQISSNNPGALKLEVIDNLGRVLISTKFNSSVTFGNDLALGTYHIRITDLATKQHLSKTIIKH